MQNRVIEPRSWHRSHLCNRCVCVCACVRACVRPRFQNQLTEGSLEQLTQDRLLVLDWTRALGRVGSRSDRRTLVAASRPGGGAHGIRVGCRSSAHPLLVLVYMRRGVSATLAYASSSCARPALLLFFLCQYLQMFEIDEVSSEKSIPAHAVTTKIDKSQLRSPNSASSESNGGAAAAAAAASSTPTTNGAPAVPAPAS